MVVCFEASLSSKRRFAVLRAHDAQSLCACSGKRSLDFFFPLTWPPPRIAPFLGASPRCGSSPEVHETELIDSSLLGASQLCQLCPRVGDCIAAPLHAPSSSEWTRGVIVPQKRTSDRERPRAACQRLCSMLLRQAIRSHFDSTRTVGAPVVAQEETVGVLDRPIIRSSDKRTRLQSSPRWTNDVIAQSRSSNGRGQELASLRPSRECIGVGPTSTDVPTATINQPFTERRHQLAPSWPSARRQRQETRMTSARGSKSWWRFPRGVDERKSVTRERDRQGIAGA